MYFGLCINIFILKYFYTHLPHLIEKNASKGAFNVQEKIA